MKTTNELLDIFQLSDPRLIELDSKYLIEVNIYHASSFPQYEIRYSFVNPLSKQFSYFISKVSYFDTKDINSVINIKTQSENKLLTEIELIEKQNTFNNDMKDLLNDSTS